MTPFGETSSPDGYAPLPPEMAALWDEMWLRAARKAALRRAQAQEEERWTDTE